MGNEKNMSDTEHEDYLKILRELKASSNGHGSIEISTVDILDADELNNKRE